MRRLPIFLASLFVVWSVVLVACSGDDESEPGAPQQAQTIAAEPRPDAAEQDQQATQLEQPDQPQPVESAEEQEQRQQTSEQVAEQTESEPVQEEQSESRAQTETQAEAEQQAQQDQQEQTAEEETKVFIGGDRPAALLVPRGADRSEPRPLIVLLHGYGSFAQQADEYFRFSNWVDKAGFGLLLPNGTRDRNGVQFWNGTEECCDMFGAEPDDVGYLKSLIEEARGHASFDQVYAVGHSNGGFMAYRLACEEVPGLAGIVSLAGGAHSAAEQCRSPEPLSVLQIHGTEDDLVLYETGRLPTHPDPDRQPVPGAWASVTRWAERAGCDINAVEELGQIDADSAVEGDETTIKRYSTGCTNSTVMELWTIEGGGHVPIVWETDFTPEILLWIDERYKRAAVASGPDSAEVAELVIGGERTARLLYPDESTDRGVPLVLSLHGYQGEAEAHDWYFGLSDRILEYGFALIMPQGTSDERGNPFWNATDGCCNFYGSEVDDYAWLSGLVAEAQEAIEVSGVFVVGYSNGGFMAYRLACDGLEGLVGIVSLAGSSFGDPERCEHTAPISVLQIHGTDDQDIPYAGTLEFERGYPGADLLMERWAVRAGCEVEAAAESPNLDLEATIDGAETAVRRYREGCVDGITVELWTIEGADHLPLFTDEWPDHLLNWLLNESRTN